MIGDSEIAKKTKKQIPKIVRFAQHRQHIFNRLSPGVGKGNKNH